MHIRVESMTEYGYECMLVTACVYNSHLYVAYSPNYTVKDLRDRYVEVLANAENNISHSDEVVRVVFDGQNTYFSMREGDDDGDLELRAYSKKSILECLRELIGGLEKCLGTITAPSTY